MNKELQRAIDESWAALDGIKNKTVTVQQAGVMAKTIQNVVHSVAIDLRERMFIVATQTHETEQLVTAPAPARIAQAQ